MLWQRTLPRRQTEAPDDSMPTQPPARTLHETKASSPSQRGGRFRNDLGTPAWYKGVEMSTILRAVSQLFRREQDAPSHVAAKAGSSLALADPVEIAPNDPLVAYFQSSVGAVDIDILSLDSPGLQALRGAGIKLVVPLVSQGELIGLLNLGVRLSDQDYSSDDRRLLENLAGHVAPAVQVAQLVRRQEAEARRRERFEQELRVAQIIQQSFLPRESPNLPGWRIAAHYGPAREVGGDFYDFIPLDDGRLGLVIGDVTDKGVPAALVMSATRSILRAAARGSSSPGDVLRRANELLCPDIPRNMFATCLFAVLDPFTGRLGYANAGHNLPYMRTSSGVLELRATGMPLGLMPGMAYEEREIVIGSGDSVLFHSDGLAEAHNGAGDMFGFPRLMGIVGGCAPGTDVINVLMAEMTGFVGGGREQEDDVTLVTLAREAAAETSSARDVGNEVLAAFTVASKPGNERIAIDRVAASVQPLDLSTGRLERLKTAVGEAAMNAMEHGNHYQPELPVSIRVRASRTQVSVEVTDHGGDQEIQEPQAPDLDAKLAGEQSPRGWGFLLMKSMVDDVRRTSDGKLHTIELVLHRGGDDDA
ncbi:MAG: SpoIIE family protein phosphatase [Chloroflexi bacterium]|nr:SpoIIE family protein phosphatase [Chloroflexota bacterium]